jgi:hypothetical protein
MKLSVTMFQLLPYSGSIALQVLYVVFLEASAPCKSVINKSFCSGIEPIERDWQSVHNATQIIQIYKKKVKLSL